MGGVTPSRAGRGTGNWGFPVEGREPVFQALQFIPSVVGWDGSTTKGSFVPSELFLPEAGFSLAFDFLARLTSVRDFEELLISRKGVGTPNPTASG